MCGVGIRRLSGQVYNRLSDCRSGSREAKCCSFSCRDKVCRWKDGKVTDMKHYGLEDGHVAEEVGEHAGAERDLAAGEARLGRRLAAHHRVDQRAGQEVAQPLAPAQRLELFGHAAEIETVSLPAPMLSASTP